MIEFIEAGREADDFEDNMARYIDEEFMKFIDVLIEAGEFDVGKKMATGDYKKLGRGAYCGLNKSIPVPDCEHVMAARGYIEKGFPKGVSPATKARIKACVNRKARILGCGGGDKKKKTESSKKSELIAHHDLIHKWYKQPDGKNLFDREALVTAHSRIVSELMKYEFPRMHKVVDELDKKLHLRYRESKED